MTLQQNAAIPLPAFSLKAFLIALGISLLYALTGYMDNARKASQPFDPKLFVKTILIAMAAAIYIVYLGLDPEKDALSAIAFIGSQATIMWLFDDFVNSLFGLNLSAKLAKLGKSSSTVNLDAFTKKTTKEQVAIIQALNIIANAGIATNPPDSPPA